jgi:hypothetical protein
MAGVSVQAAAGDFPGVLVAPVERNLFGEVGLLDMPCAHMAPDGQLAFTFGDLEKTQRYSLAFQALPWLETSFRYSAINGLFGYKTYYNSSFGLKIRLAKEGPVYPDVSIGIRDLLGTGIYSSEYITASKHLGDFDFTLGLGWGRLADRPVFSNPFGLVFSSFKQRQNTNPWETVNPAFFRGAKTGLFGGINWQTPIMGLKLLAEYSSDKYTAEGGGRTGLKLRSPFNVGLTFHPLDTISLSAGWFYGTTYGFSLNIHGDPTKTYPSAIRIGPVPPRPAIRTQVQQQNALSTLLDRNGQVRSSISGGPWVQVMTTPERTRQELREAVFSGTRSVRDVDFLGTSLIVDASIAADPDGQCATYARAASVAQSDIKTIAISDLQDPGGLVVLCKADGKNIAATLADAAVPEAQFIAAAEKKITVDLQAQGLIPDAVHIGNGELWVYFENYRYQRWSKASGRVIRVLMADAPPSVEIFHLVTAYLGVPDRQITIARSVIERAVADNLSSVALAGNNILSPAPLDNPALDQAAAERYPLFNFSLDPKVTQRMFDPDAPLQFNIYGQFAAMLQIAPGLSLSGVVTGNIWNNYPFTRQPSSTLPHVRSEVMQYLKHGQYGITNLMLDYRMRLLPEVSAELRAGYLEDMYMGAGGQLLWRPEASRFAFGADIYQVWKRDFNRLFGKQDYHVLTGHVSVYYRSPWYGLNFATHLGRYLARDYGATFEVTRRFSSGVEIGAWATFTNVPFSKFGEGSFDKGIIIHIPFEWGLPIWSQTSYDLHLHSLTRDGGQRLSGDDSLFGITDGTSYGEIAENLNDLVEP